MRKRCRNLREYVGWAWWQSSVKTLATRQRWLIRPLSILALPLPPQPTPTLPPGHCFDICHSGLIEPVSAAETKARNAFVQRSRTSSQNWVMQYRNFMAIFQSDKTLPNVQAEKLYLWPQCNDRPGVWWGSYYCIQKFAMWAKKCTFEQISI